MTMESNNSSYLTDKQSWERGSFNEADLLTIDKRFHGILSRYLEFNREKTVFEVGCYPGRFLLYFYRQYGYKPSGIDYATNTKEIELYFQKHKVDYGNIYCQDIFEFAGTEKYDVVYSLGFIEHFRDFNEIVRLHENCLKENGVLVIGLPNFNNVFKKILRYKEIEGHNLEMMNVDFIRTYFLNRRRNYEILYLDFIVPQLFYDLSEKKRVLGEIINRLNNFSNRNYPLVNKRVLKKVFGTYILGVFKFQRA